MNRVLIVRHGPKRGRLEAYFQDGLDHLNRTRPELHACLAFWGTGMAPPDLDGVRAVVFWLGDPLKEMYPDCYRDAMQVAEAARARGIRLVNPPESLSNSIKTRQSQLWRAAGVPTPAAHAFSSVDELAVLVERMTLPVMVRPDQLHAQAGIRVCNTKDKAIEAARRLLPVPSLVVELQDVRRSWKQKDPRSIYARLFHKKRCFVLGPRVKTGHVFFSTIPIVATQTCTFSPQWRRSKGLTEAPLPGTPDVLCVEADNAFGNGMPEHADLFVRAAEALGMAFTAIDYSCDADGGVVLWESNPYFFLPPLRVSMMPVARQSATRYAAIHDAVGRFLSDLAGDGDVRNGR